MDEQRRALMLEGRDGAEYKDLSGLGGNIEGGYPRKLIAN